MHVLNQRRKIVLRQLIVRGVRRDNLGGQPQNAIAVGVGGVFALARIRDTVGWVQVPPPVGVGTPRSVSARAMAAWPTIPSASNRSYSNPSRCAARYASWRRAAAAAPASGPRSGR